MKRIDDQARVINFYQLWELLPQAGKIEQVLFEITDVNGKTGKLIVKNADKVELLNKKLIQELREKGVKFTEENLMWLFKNKDGKIIFLEKGKNSGGFQHILKHKEEFLDKGVFEEDLAEFIMESLKNGKIVGKEGSRFVYEYIYKGIKQTTAITVSSNGFVVGANPVSKFKKL